MTIAARIPTTIRRAATVIRAAFSYRPPGAARGLLHSLTRITLSDKGTL